MNRHFLKNWVLCITLATTAIGSTGKVWADDEAINPNGDTVEVNLIDAVQNAPDDAINQAVQTANQQIAAAVPATATDEQKSKAQAMTAVVTGESQRPDFKARMISVLKRTRHDGGKAGMIILKTTGIVGNAVLGTAISPLIIGENLVTSAISGHGMVATHPDTDPNSLDSYDAAYGEFGGAVAEVYVLVAAYAAGFTLEPWFLIDSILERGVQLSICGIQNQGPELQSYCRLSNGVYNHIVYGAAMVGDVVGKGVHLAIVIPAHLVGKLIHHHKKAPAPVPVIEEPAQPVQQDDTAPAAPVSN